MTTLKSLTRRTRCGISRFLWKWTRGLRKPPPQIAAIDPLIVQAWKAHKPRRSLYQKRQELAHEQLRKGVMQ